MALERHLLSLPAEIRLHIFDHVFERRVNDIGFVQSGKPRRGLIMDEAYSIRQRLAPLLVCQQMHEDVQPLAFNRTHFIVSSLFTKVADRLSILHAKQIQSLRNIAFVADARHFRQLVEWGECPFGVPDLNLDTLTVVLHRASHWHYLFDYTHDITMLLRHLKGVRRLVFVRNDAKVKGSFKTWFNRLVGLMMKIDHQERYLNEPANPESVWWTWDLDEEQQVITLTASPQKEWVDEESYMQQMTPLMDDLMKSIESEEWNPDPRARIMYY